MAGIDDFITRWQGSGGAERANYTLFLGELCDLLDLPRPLPSPADYDFEHGVTFNDPGGGRSGGRIDLYKRGCFVLEAKQGTDATFEQLALFSTDESRAGGKGHGVRGTKAYALAMQRARGQAERYAKALPADHGWPPFLVIVDVGHSIELFADFSLSGKSYAQFPDAQRFRIMLADLRLPEVRDRLHKVWTEPLSLDPAKVTARVTREIAAHLADLAKLLERRGQDPARVATFLMRCLFTMFAEDVRLLPQGCFQNLLKAIVDARRPDKFKPQVEQLWQAMNQGGFAHAIEEFVPAFNGGLFTEATALSLDIDEIGVLLVAAKADWRDVEPAIFGTLVERALEKEERHRLGAHFTPRAYVERLVVPTVIEPLREDWAGVQAVALHHELAGERAQGLAAVREFHRKLCATRVLDPACGTGNFLYVAMELIKRLEGEVIEAARALGEDQYFLELDRHTVDPHQFLGIEINPRAAAIAELVLWIGWLQWHFRTRGQVMPAQPVLRNFKNIECRDAILAYDRIELARDEKGRPITRWDGRTMKKHPVTGRDVPDDRAQVSEERYVNPRAAPWPEAEFVVGNPPFIGTKRMRAVQGDGYVEAARSLDKSVPASADYVMFWWSRAASLVTQARLRRFGLVSTNSIGQSFNREVIVNHCLGDKRLGLLFAVPDHPWVNSKDAAAVRIAMTVVAHGQATGRLWVLRSERKSDSALAKLDFDVLDGLIGSDLRMNSEVSRAEALRANGAISGMGVALHGSGFVLDRAAADHLRQSGYSVIKRYIGGIDLLREPRERFLIDFSFMTEAEALSANPSAFQHVMDHVKPERDNNKRESIKRLWWRFGWERPEVRRALHGLPRFIVTTETAKHRLFQLLSTNVLPDHKIIAFALSDGFHLAVLSSRAHVGWALAAGGRLGVGNDPVYNKTRCFDPFPFPDPDEGLRVRLRELGEQLDGHRKARQSAHPGLTMTGMYNVLEKLRKGEELSAKERVIHEEGLVSVLLDLHERIDDAVLDAYGWARDLGDEAILERLVALNRERVAEERQGLVRWLRPEYQRPLAKAVRPMQEEMAVGEGAVVAAPIRWPKPLALQVQAVTGLLGRAPAPVDVRDVVAGFEGAKERQILDVLRALVALGHARALPEGRFAA